MQIIYNVTVNIDLNVHEEWVSWMKEVHIKDVMETGLFLEARFSRILAEEDGGKSYSIQYLCCDMETLRKYEEEFAPKLQADHSSKFAGKFAAFRTLLRVDKTF